MNSSLPFISTIPETTLLKVTNDILLAFDAGMCSVVVLLDVSAAFDTIDHCILLHRLKH